MSQNILDLYTDFLIGSSTQRSSTGMSAALCGELSHDQITRFLSGSDYGSKDLWQEVKPHVRAIENEDGVLIFDDTIEAKPHTDENPIICWHYDHCSGRNVKGMNILSALVNHADVSLPVAFEVVRKEVEFCDITTKRQRRVSDRSKNEMFRDMIDVSISNHLKFRYVLADIWFGSKENMNHILSHDKHFIFAIKGNRTVALSHEEKLRGVFTNIASLELDEKDKKVWLKGVDHPVLLIKQVFKNKDGSTGILYLVASDNSLDVARIIDLYKKRWKIEGYHKSIKSNAGLAKSPTRTVRTQTTHIFATLCAFIKMETLKIKTNLNHFALKQKLMLTATKAAMEELEKIKNLQTA